MAAAPPLPPALFPGRGPGPAGLSADGARGRRAEGARVAPRRGGGWRGGRRAHRAGGEDPAGGGLGARSLGLGPRRSERESKTGDRAASPGAALSPPGLEAVRATRGRRGRAGPSGAEGGGGSGSEGVRAGTLPPEAPAPGLPESRRSARRRAGHRSGINFPTTVPSPGKRLHVAPQVAEAVLPPPPLPLRR